MKESHWRMTRCDTTRWRMTHWKAQNAQPDKCDRFRHLLWLRRNHRDLVTLDDKKYNEGRSLAWRLRHCRDNQCNSNCSLQASCQVLNYTTTAVVTRSVSHVKDTQRRKNYPDACHELFWKTTHRLLEGSRAQVLSANTAVSCATTAMTPYNSKLAPHENPYQGISRRVETKHVTG